MSMDEQPDLEMLAVLDLLLNLDALDYESDWDTIEALVRPPPAPKDASEP